VVWGASERCETICIMLEKVSIISLLVALWYFVLRGYDHYKTFISNLISRFRCCLKLNMYHHNGHIISCFGDLFSRRWVFSHLVSTASCFHNLSGGIIIGDIIYIPLYINLNIIPMLKLAYQMWGYLFSSGIFASFALLWPKKIKTLFPVTCLRKSRS